MKKVIATLLQFILFLLAFFVGSFIYHPFRIESTLPMRELHTRSFIWDGVLLMLITYVLMLTLQAARKRLKSQAVPSTIALLLAALAGYAMRFGFITHSW